VRLTGDGVIARFDGPSRAIGCGLALQVAAASLGIEIRAGLHAGEIELRGDEIYGIAMHVAQRVQGLAEAGEVLVSEAVPLLVIGSGVQFRERGEHELKGLPGTWKLYAVDKGMGQLAPETAARILRWPSAPPHVMHLRTPSGSETRCPRRRSA
jgi:class 3 adenylate cyclase